MKHDLLRYMRVYSVLLHLYPYSFRHQFSEQMYQTFGDMLNNQAENNENLGIFTLKMCLETFLQIIKEHSEEIAMNTRTMSLKKKASISLALVLLISFTFIIVRNNGGDTIIRPNSTFAEAKKQSAGTLEKCLTNNDSVKEEIKKSEPVATEEQKKEPYYSDTQNFDMTLLSGIIDVPAGTYADVYYATLDAGTAKGSVKYAGEYGNYNYEMKFKDNKWQLIGLKACRYDTSAN